MSAPTPCPRCGTPGSGNFCSNCGASRGALPCPACGHEPEPGARFCTQCGQALNPGAAPAAGAPDASSAAAGAGSGREGALGWWIAGLALAALILVVGYPVLTGADDGPPPSPVPAAAPGGAGAVDLGSMSPREAADRLYNRVMGAASVGDSAEVTMFLPMAIAAHDRARPLDPDGLYHLGLLHLTAGDAEAALATALEALEDAPDHLLNLGAAADAAEITGDAAMAQEYWERFLEVYDAEIASGKEEYDIHDGSLSEFLRRARASAGA